MPTNSELVCLPGQTGRSRRAVTTTRMTRLLHFEQADEGDLATCNQLCRRVHGHDRTGELKDAIQGKTATVVEHLGRITGYATSIGFFAHAIAETNEDLMALVSAAPNIQGPESSATMHCFHGAWKTA